jgi:hypothetical protein
MAAMGKKAKATPKPDDPAQYKRFLEAAREAEAEDTKEAADRAFKTIAAPKKPSRLDRKS